MHTWLGLDLGTATTVARTHEGFIWQEPTIVAIGRKDQHVLAMGHKAKVLVGREPRYLHTVHPVQSGVVADVSASNVLVRHLLRKASRYRWLKPRVVAAVEPGVPTSGRQLLVNLLYGSGAREVILLPTPVAAAMGSDLIEEVPRGLLIVDIGGGTIDASVLSMGQIVAHASSPLAGTAVDSLVVQHVRQVYNLVIGAVTAERVKIAVGSAIPPQDHEATALVSGRCQVTGLPKRVDVHAREVYEALRPAVEEVRRVVLQVLAETPPELIADVVDGGLWLTGGGSMLPGLTEFLAEATGITAQLVPDPVRAVALGTAKVFGNAKAYGLKAVPR